MQMSVLYQLENYGVWRTIPTADSFCLLSIPSFLQRISQFFPSRVHITSEPRVGHADLAEGAIVHPVGSDLVQLGGTYAQRNPHWFPFQNVHKLIGDVAHG